ncbi:uncharacterized protein LOC302367 [Rattus norvegicus]|uniref:RGD1561552 protein n=1 Tax=Rattus norvegicus TaxID=10116 RepID=B1WC92_RAT|nr:uncharacterized protein LOC302367 [Rattus norvegicus]AAI62049.1 RGD1561552 protein [Rattus norvegicus]|eukprot:NP_001119743.1 uncharacterized protein LOC302367 [Rattus norvegicus]
MAFNEDILRNILKEHGTINEIKNEFIYIILTSLSKIVRQVNDLDKFTEDVLGKLDKEIHDLSFKLKILQENIIQLTNAIHKIPNDILSMQLWKSRKTFSKITIETQQVYSCTSLPIKIFERNNANIRIPLLTVPEYYQNDMEDSPSSNGLFHPCLYCSKLLKDNVSVNKQLASEKKHTQNQNLTHAGDFKNVLQCHLLKKHIPVDHIPASGSEVSHSYLDQYGGGSSFYIFPPNRNKHQGTSAANILPSEQEQLHYHIGCMSNSRPRVLYGTGKGDVVVKQRRVLTHYKSNVFVNPLAPKAPPLPSDWLIHLISSKKPSASGVISSRGTSSFFVLGKTKTLPSACLKSNPNIDLTVPPEVEVTATSESLERYELKPGGLSPQDMDQKIPLLLYPSVIPLRNQSWDSVVTLIDSLVEKPQPIKSSFPKSPRSLSKSKYAHGSLPQHPVANTSRTFSAQLPKSYRVPRHSFSVSASPSPKPQTSSNVVPKRSVSHLTKLIEAQSRSPVTYPKRHLHPPQAKPSKQLNKSNLTKVSTLQSSLSSMKSSASNHRALAKRHYRIESAYASILQNTSILPIMTKARKALMEAIRKGIKLRKTRPRAESDDPENEAKMIRFRRKAMGYHSGKSDSETEWVE